MNELKISDQLKKDIQAVLTRCANSLIKQMEIGSMDQLRVSLDLNLDSKGKEIGIKVNAFRYEKAELLYDESKKKE